VDAREILAEMLERLGIQAKVEKFTTEGHTMLHIETPEAGRLIGKQGWTLNDLQYLLNIILWRKDPNAQRVVVDVERYRERQRDEILKKVYEAIERVKRWGEPITLEPMNAFDRRLVHQTVAKDPEMESISDESGSEGDRKSITIRLKKV
jgi:spoIIIJ-associated protein